MNKLRTIGVWILQVLLAALFAIQGIVKLSGSPAWVSRFRGWGYPDHFYFVVGLVELIAAIALLIPRVAKLGALLLIVVMAGATATHVVHRESQVFTPLLLIALLLITLYVRRGTAATKESTRIDPA
jgi:putative oxidoreductase